MPPGVDDAGSTEVVQFVLDCLVKMPLIICEAIANQVRNVLVLLKMTLNTYEYGRLAKHLVSGSLTCVHMVCSHSWILVVAHSVVVELPVVWPVTQRTVAASCVVNLVLSVQLQPHNKGWTVYMHSHELLRWIVERFTALCACGVGAFQLCDCQWKI